jgi:phosphatidylinositol alpha-mannosyltransferase
MRDHDRLIGCCTIKRMNIGMVSPYDWDYPGGVNRHVANLSGHLRQRGHEVMVIAPGGRNGEGFHSVGGSFAVSSNRSVAHLSFGPRVATHIKRLLKETPFDVLHLHEPLIPSASLLALLYSRCANLASFHAAREKGSLGYRLSRPLLRPLSGKLHMKAAVSPAAMGLVSRYFPGEYRILPNGVDVDVFTPRGPFLEDLDEDAYYLIFVGRDEPRKGLDIMLEALPLVREKHPEIRLLVIGAAREAGAHEGVKWMGRLPDEAIPAGYRSARVMVSPALGGESFGIVLIEAMACGLPVVASDIPGYRAVIDDGVQGTLTPPGDPLALSRAIIGLVDDENKRKRMAGAALLKSSLYSWERLVKTVEETYAETLERWRRSSR